MDITNVKGTDIETYWHGKMNLTVGLCESMGIPDVFNKYLNSDCGRTPDSPYGVLAEMLMVNICSTHRPLYRLKDFYTDVDLSGIFHCEIDLNKITDDRFGLLLDKVYEAGARKIFGEISSNAFALHNLTVKNINYDTTSMVMWGEYETTEGKLGVISIDFGHSKQKREDKKQIKLGIGTANGVIVDAKVLSGNKDDKTYNNENLDDVNSVIERFDIDKENFYYIADSALFTKENLEKAKGRIKLITRMPDNTIVAKELIDGTLADKSSMKELVMNNAQGKPVQYFLSEKTAVYNGINLKCAVCYSTSLEETKKKTIEKKVAKEEETIAKLIKKYTKRTFACENDANKEVELLTKKDLSKLKFFNYNIDLVATEKKAVGRPSSKESNKDKQFKYELNITFEKDESKIAKIIEKECTFVLCSTDLSISAEDILLEYKTQSSIEKKFQQLKSPHFVNSLYLNSPERIEALTYIILISMMVLSVAEQVVRAGLKKEKAFIIGPGQLKMTRPTLNSILEVFDKVPMKVFTSDGRKQRIIGRPFNDSQSKILRYLLIPEEVFCWNDVSIFCDA